jgi:hypothetical protein
LVSDPADLHAPWGGKESRMYLALCKTGPENSS